MKKLLVLIFALCSFITAAQISATIVDSNSNLPLPFVNILIDNGPNGTVSNIDGQFTIKQKFNTLTLTFVGYESLELNELKHKSIIRLNKSTEQIQEVEVVPGINPAHRIIRQSSKRRKENNPNGSINYTLETYNKFVFTGDIDALSEIQDKDSNEMKLLETLEKQHLFMIESVSKTDHHKVSGSQNKIIASKTSGLKNPIISALFTQLQTFSFYDNVLELGGYSFISPLAPGGPNRYLYVLEDSIKNEDSYTFVIRYQPRAKKNFDGLKGVLYINSENYAIEKISASPTKPIQGADVSLLQSYKKAGNHWFPLELYTEIKIPNITANNAPLMGIGKSYIRNIDLEPEIKFGNNGFSLEVEENAVGQSDEYWDSKRKDTITIRESETYRIVDSISEAKKVERKLEVVQSLMNGQIPIAFIDIDLYEIVHYNPFEGWGLGLSAHTNKKMSKVFSFGGFFRYSFKDKRLKYGGDFTFHLLPKRKVFLNVDYREDVAERGERDFIDEPNLVESSAGFKPYFILPREYMRRLQITLGGYVRGNFQLNAFANYQRRYFFDEYRFQTGFEFENSKDKFNLFEVGFTGRWTIKEKVIQSGGTIISMGSKYPTIQFTYKKGIKGVLNSRYSYSNIQLRIDQEFTLRGVGKLLLQANGSTTFGTAPLSLLQFANGTNAKFGISVQNSFETMRSGEFLSDKQANLFITMAFNSINTSLKWTAPQFSLSSGAGVGGLINSHHHTGYEFKTMEKGYYESGLIMNNILKYKFLGAGFGLFYKYGPYASIYEKDNFAYKLTLQLNF